MANPIATLTVMRGELDRLPGLLENLSGFEERHLVETGESAEPLRELDRVVVHHAPLPWGAAFDAARNAAVPSIKAPWVLIVDTDERIPPSLVQYLQARMQAWEQEGVEGVFLPRRNHVLGRPLSHSSSWPDYQLRFIRRERLKFGAELHKFNPVLEKTVHAPVDDAVALRHYSFESTREYVQKINLYSSIEADQSEAKGSIVAALGAAARDFGGRYIRKRGFLDGQAGLHFAIMMAFYRYLATAKRGEKTEK